MKEQAAPSVVCLGFFDGVHRGHRALLQAAREIAAAEGLCVCAHTFDHAPGNKDFELTTLSEREALLRSAGADRVAISVFDENMRHMSGEDFFSQVVLQKLGARHVVCGDDHRFGYRGACGVAELREMCQRNGVGLTVVPPITLDDGTRVSSSAIRRALQQGNWALAEGMLGRELPDRLKHAPESNNP